MNRKVWLGALIGGSVVLSGCSTHVMSLPMRPVLDHTAGDSPIALYFAAQEVPPVVSVLGKATAGVRIARNTDGREAACNHAFSDALAQLREQASMKKGNGVINIVTNFHGNKSANRTDFTCGVSPSAAAITVHGDIVMLQRAGASAQ